MSDQPSGIEPHARIKGVVIRARRAFVEEHFGAGSWDRVVASLEPADQTALKSILLPSGWYPFALGERLDRAIVGVLGNGHTGVFEEIGARSARENLQGAHHHFLTAGNPQAFLAKTATIYSFYYSTGRREYEPTGPTSGVITTRDAATCSHGDCLTVVGWYKEALRLCGARDVEVVEETCRARGGTTCRYRLSWR